MFKHLLKLVWNRKRANFLIILEMLISFLVVFALSLLALSWADNYRHPLGYDYRDVWVAEVRLQRSQGNEGVAGEPTVSLKQMMQAARELPEVVSVAGMSHSPYANSQHRGVIRPDQREIEHEWATASDDLPAVLGINVKQGRWFNDEDASSNYRSIIINEQLARTAWGDADPIGKVIEDNPDEQERRKPRRVVGVVSDFRMQGEFERPSALFFERRDPDGNPGSLLIRVRPGTPAAFEEKLLRRLQATAKDAAFNINPMEGMRESNTKLMMIPLIIFGLITVFLMLMVALGLLGVLYQNVTQRTREIGLRRALGAPAQAINRQILAELLLMTSLGVVIGILIVIQFPLLNIFDFLRTDVFAASIAMALAVIYSLTICCGLYPSWMATRVPPAEALHYE